MVPCNKMGVPNSKLFCSQERKGEKPVSAAQQLYRRSNGRLAEESSFSLRELFSEARLRIPNEREKFQAWMKNGCHLTAVPWSLLCFYRRSSMVFRKRESRLNIYCTILTPTFGFAGKFHPGLGPKGNRSRKQVTYLIMSWNNGMKKTRALRGGETTRQESRHIIPSAYSQNAMEMVLRLSIYENEG